MLIKFYMPRDKKYRRNVCNNKGEDSTEADGLGDNKLNPISFRKLNPISQRNPISKLNFIIKLNPISSLPTTNYKSTMM